MSGVFILFAYVPSPRGCKPWSTVVIERQQAVFRRTSEGERCTAHPMKRRSFLIGSASGLTLLALTACFPSEPKPTASATPKPTTPAPDGLPKPLRMQRSNWANDPFARGAYSYPQPDTSEVQREQLRRTLNDRVFFAGEATASDAPGTVHGALGSGLRAALDISDAATRGERIAVIGAGIAGLTAARQLQESGFEVVVIEARDRIGGRIQSITDSSWPVPVELGSLFVSGTSSVLAGQLALAEVSSEPFERVTEVRTPLGAVIEPSDAGTKAVASASEWATQNDATTSLAQALIDSGAASALSAEPADNGVAQADWLPHQLAVAVEPAAGASADQIAAQQSEWLQSMQAAQAQIITGSKDGLSGLIDTIAQGIDVLVGSPVATVFWGDDGVSLRLAQGESLSASRVLVTVPLGVLQHDSALFEPALPEWKTAAIDEIGMGTVDNVWLEFDEAFWATDATQLSTIVASGDAASGAELGITAAPNEVAYWTNLQPLTGSPILVGTIAAEHAAELGALNDDDFLARILASLNSYAADPAFGASPTPTPSESD